MLSLMTVLSSATFTGVLMFDEMSVRKGLHLRQSDMALLGKVDYGDKTRSRDES